MASVPPAFAEDPVAPEVTDVPAVLGADLSPAEEQQLSALVAGGGVPVDAFVVTPEGPEIITVDADSRTDADAAARLLEAQPSVEAASLTVEVRATAGSRPQYGNVMVRSEQAMAGVDNPLSDVVVAVLDTGVAPHPELVSALLPGRSFSSGVESPHTDDRNGHGTHVAGTVAADVGSAVEGVAVGAKILPVKVIDDSGSGLSTWISQGIVWAADNGADVINLSLGGTNSSGVYASSVAYARSRGATVIAAAGNDGDSIPFYPAAETGVIAVSAVDSTELQASFSNYGSYVDIAAPGVWIESTRPSGDTAQLSGTSMASPHVAGVAALVKAAAPGLTPDQVEQALVAGVIDLGPPGRDDVFGHGRVDAVHAVQAANSLEATGTVPVNRAPVADDETFDLLHDPAEQTFDVLSGDTDPDGDPVRLVSATQGSHGVVTVQGAALRYQATAVGPLTDTVAYTVTDRRGGTATGTVTVNLAAPDPSNRAPVAGDDRRTIAYNATRAFVPVNLNDSDPDGHPLRVKSVTQPARGATTVSRGDIFYTPPRDTAGQALESFQYTVTDSRGGYATATVTVDVPDPNTVPVAVPDTLAIPHDAASGDVQPALNDTDADGDTLRLTSIGTAVRGTVQTVGTSVLRYTPSEAFPLGTTDTVTYGVSDGRGGSATGTVNVVVEAEPTVGSPGAPMVGAPTAGEGSAVVRWTAPSDTGNSAITGYTVRTFRGGSLVATTTVGASETSTTVGDLVNGQPYVFRVSAANDAGPGVSGESSSVTPRTRPGAPVVRGVTAEHRSAYVTWITPVFNGGAAITGYTVHARRDSAVVRTVTVGAATQGVVVGGLVNGADYVFTVSASNEAGTGTASAESATVRPRGYPDAPVIGATTPGNASATVRWAPPANDGGSAITGYVVNTYVDSDLVQSTNAPAGATHLTVTGLTNGRPHTFIVTAVNGAGQGDTSGMSTKVTPAAPPTAPRIGTPSPGAASAYVRWAAPLSNGGSPVTGYTVRAYRGPTLVKTVQAGPAAVGATVIGLANGSAHTFLVTARNAVGESVPSARSAGVVPRTVPSAPRISGVAAGRSAATVAWVAPSNGGSPITGYLVRIYRGTAVIKAIRVSARTLRLTVAGLAPGVGHSFTVQAGNAAGAGSVSARSATVVPQR